MPHFLPYDRFLFYFNRLQERLWVKPFGACLLSLLGILIASAIDHSDFAQDLPEVSLSSVEALLQILTGSMLAIATFSVGAMVSAYGSASTTATPRSFSVVISDDSSQNALSIFIAAFIFSVVGLTSLKNGLLQGPGRTVLFGICVYIFVLVIYSFVKWVDRIARLGRLGTTISNVEKATAQAFKRRYNHPTLKANPLDPSETEGIPILAENIGHLQRVDIQELQNFAETHHCTLAVLALPGDYICPHQPLAKMRWDQDPEEAFNPAPILKAFQIGKDRIFDEDPRFGLIVLSEIAGKALSPGINDPGTAIDVLGSLHRLLNEWGQPRPSEEKEPKYNRIYVPGTDTSDLFEDAFSSLARDGASCVEVVLRLQTILGSLSQIDHPEIRQAAHFQAEKSLARSQSQLSYAPDFERIKKTYTAKFSDPLKTHL